MTPERQCWWDSLPTEEKRVREDIDEFKRMIRHNKKHLIPYVAFAKYCIRYNKKAIKALRKQIAMSPLELFAADGTTDKLCPCCYKMVFALDKYCRGCGQKLRWKKCVD